MSIWTAFLILIVGIAAGFLNTVAAGGSLLSLPVLIFLGLPAAVANGTNRIALMVQSISAVVTFRRKGFFDWKLSLVLGIPAMLGSIIGTKIAISIPDRIFNIVLAFVMLVVLVLTLKPSRKKEVSQEMELTPLRKVLAIIVFFFVGMYGGFIQAGVGFFIMASMSIIASMSLVRVNSIKVFVVGLYMIVSLAIFIYSGQVDWVLGLTLAAGNGIGAIIGSVFTVNKGEKWIRVILAIVIVIMAVKLLLQV